MILSRRNFLRGASALLVAPAIVRVDALMQISAPWVSSFEWLADGTVILQNMAFTPDGGVRTSRGSHMRIKTTPHRFGGHDTLSYFDGSLRLSTDETGIVKIPGSLVGPSRGILA